MGPELAEPEKQKFVEIRIVEIVNPKQTPLSLRVRYRPRDGTEVLLGSIAPYPADNPGTFLVATRGLLRSGGAVVVSLVPLRATAADDEVQVSMRIAFRTE